MELRYAIVGAIIVSFALVHINQRLASPVVAIADRWLRWIIFPVVGAWLCRDFDLIDRPLWVLAVGAAVLAFVLHLAMRGRTVALAYDPRHASAAAARGHRARRRCDAAPWRFGARRAQRGRTSGRRRCGTAGHHPPDRQSGNIAPGPTVP